MKTILGWLSDPFLHLVGIGVVVLIIGSRMTSDSGADEVAAFGRCDVCQRDHDLSQVCQRVAVKNVYAVQQ